MAQGDWAEVARGLRKEQNRLGAALERNADTTDIRSAILVLEALENVAMRLAGGYVHD